MMRTRSSAAQDSAEAKAAALLGQKPDEQQQGAAPAPKLAAIPPPLTGTRIPRTRSQAAQTEFGQQVRQELPDGTTVQKAAADADLEHREKVSQAADTLVDAGVAMFGEVGSELERDKAAREKRDRDRAKQAPAEVQALTMGPGYDRIVDLTFSIDPLADFERLRNSLKLGVRASRADYGTLVDALDEAEDNAHKAFLLSVNAKAAHDAFEIDSLVIKGSMRDRAMASLQEEKDAGKRSKTITNDDIEATMAAHFPDQYRLLEQKRSRARRTVASLEDLATRWAERAKDLRQMVARSRDA